jgi:lysozyme
MWEATYLPYGQEWNPPSGSGPVSPNHYKFTGKERDPESGLDYFGARYYTSLTGRFISPDLPGIDQHLTNPQTLNLYVYARNNPLAYTDPTGHSADRAVKPGLDPVLPYESGGGMTAFGDMTCMKCEEMEMGWGNAEAFSVFDGIRRDMERLQQQQQQAQQQQMSLSSQGLDFIKNHEGFNAQVYLDSAGLPTIGYGHLIKPGENFSAGISQQQATALLAQDVNSAVGAVSKGLRVPVSQSQFDALVSFAYNVGTKNLQKSTLLKNVNAAKPVTQKNFTDWNKAGGKVVRGLTIRRRNEFNLFANGIYATP